MAEGLSSESAIVLLVDDDPDVLTVSMHESGRYLFPPAIGAVPDPALEATKPPFMFYFFYSFENFLGISGIVYSAAALFGLLAVVPFVDRTPLRHLRKRPTMAAIGAFLLVAVIALSIYVAVSGTGQHLGSGKM